MSCTTLSGDASLPMGVLLPWLEVSLTFRASWSKGSEPYNLTLLRDLPITRPNHVWCTDVTYIPLQRGFLYLVAVMDWASRKVLAWRLSNSLAAELLRRGLAKRRSRAMVLPRSSIATRESIHQRRLHRRAQGGWRSHLDGWQGPLDGQRVYRAPGRSLKYECVYLAEFTTGSEARTASAGGWTSTTGAGPTRPLNGRTPEEAYTSDEADRAWGSTPPPASQTQLES